MQISSRHHLRSDEVGRLETELDAGLGVSIGADSYELVEFDDSPNSIVLVDGDPLLWYVEEEPFVTVRGANALEPTRNLVTVDSGAISFVSDGADVMRPGITEADDAIEADELAVVVEEAHGKALAVGRARVSGDEMTGESGKVLDSLHHVGDEIYEFSV